MIRNSFIVNTRQVTKKILRRCSTKIDLEKLEKESAVAVEVLDDDAAKKEAELEKKRNKSRLTPHHRNIIHDKRPYNESMFWTHDTIKYTRKMYGKYGQESGVDPSLCWPTKQELEDKLDYEKVAYPLTIQEMIEKAHKDRKETNERIAKREQEILTKMAKLEQWKKELFDKIKKKETEELKAKEKKERLIEEVRRHFGYTIDPRDEKFKEMVEMKEKEQKKLEKEARKKAKEERMLSKLIGKKSEEDAQPEQPQKQEKEDEKPSKENKEK